MTPSLAAYALGFGTGFAVWPLAYVLIRRELRGLRR